MCIDCRASDSPSPSTVPVLQKVFSKYLMNKSSFPYLLLLCFHYHFLFLHLVGCQVFSGFLQQLSIPQFAANGR